MSNKEDTNAVFTKINKQLTNILNGMAHRVVVREEGHGHITVTTETVWLDKDGKEKEHPIMDCDCGICRDTKLEREQRKLRRRNLFRAVLRVFGIKL